MGVPIRLLVVEATERACELLGGLRVDWVPVQRDGEANELPSPERVIPARRPESLAEDPIAQAYRALFWDLGIDPTKQRPAGEALARRVAQGKGLPSILPLVDAYNLASAATLVPVSAFDAGEVQGELRLDVSEQDQPFQPIGGDAMTLEEGLPIWADDEGVVGLVLHRDGQRTALHEKSDRALLVAAGPAALGPRVLPELFRQLEPFVGIAGWRFEGAPRQLKL